MAWSCPWCCPSERLGVQTDHVSSKWIPWTPGPGNPLSRGQMSGRQGRGRLGIRELSAGVAAPRGLVAGQALEKDSGSRVYLWEKDSADFTGRTGPSHPSCVYSHTVTAPRDLGKFGISDLIRAGRTPTETWKGAGRSPGPIGGAVIITQELLCVRLYFCLFYFCSIRQSPGNRRLI